jgi:hypothetical protein
MHPAKARLLTETLRIAPHQGQDMYGKPVYGTDVTVQARIERHFETQMGPNGAQLTEETQVYVNGDTVVEERSRITFEDGAVVPLEGIKPVLDPQGSIDHFVLFF